MRKLALFITAVCVLFSIKYNDGLRAEVFMIKNVIFLVILRYLIIHARDSNFLKWWTWSLSIPADMTLCYLWPECYFKNKVVLILIHANEKNQRLFRVRPTAAEITPVGQETGKNWLPELARKSW